MESQLDITKWMMMTGILNKILEQKQKIRIQKQIDLHNNLVKHDNFEIDDLEQEMHFETKRANRVKPSRIIIKYPEV